MPAKDDSLYLRHVLDAIERAMRHVSGMTHASFLDDEMAQDAVVRQLEIVGEAARHVSDAFRDEHTEVPWLAIVGMRNRLVHEYFGVNLEVVWDTVEKDLPVLRDLIGEAVARTENP